MFFEIGTEIVGMKMNGLGHLVDADARMKTAVHILLNDAQSIHFLCSVLKHANRDGIKEAAYDFKQHSFLSQPSDDRVLFMPCNELLE